MTNENSSTDIAPRCQFQFSDDRCCRMLRSPAHPSYCAFHARQELQRIESQRLGEEVSTSLHGNFLTATDINHVLGKLFIAVAQNRISLRKAASLTHLGKALLSSIPLIKQEFRFEYKFKQWQNVLANAAPLSDPPPFPNSEPSPECPPEPTEPDSPEED
jgi:hypothetical protein